MSARSGQAPTNGEASNSRAVRTSMQFIDNSLFIDGLHGKSPINHYGLKVHSIRGGLKVLNERYAKPIRKTESLGLKSIVFTSDQQ